MKKIILFIVFLVILNAVYATGFPVVDFSHIAQTVLSMSQEIDRWKQQLKKWEQEYQKATRAAEAIASGDYLTLVDGILDMSKVLADYRTTPYSLSDSWLATVEKNINSIGLYGYTYGMPIKNILNDNISLTHSTAKIKQTITNTVKRYNKAAAGNMINCSVCGGSGQVLGMCESCGGTGYKSIISSWESTKEYEFGEFLERCTNCGGSGRILRKCQNCKGSGKVKEAETYRSISVDGLINLLGNTSDFLNDLGDLAGDLGDLQVSPSEYKEILEAVRDDYLKKFSYGSINDIVVDITENKKKIVQEQKEQEKCLTNDLPVQAAQHELTAKKLNDTNNDLIILYDQLSKLQGYIDQLKIAAEKDYKYQLYKDIQEGVERTYKQINQQFEELSRPKYIDINKIPLSAFN